MSALSLGCVNGRSRVKTATTETHPVVVFLPWRGRWSGCRLAGPFQTAGSPLSRGPLNPGSPPSAASPPLQHREEEDEEDLSSLYFCPIHMAVFNRVYFGALLLQHRTPSTPLTAKQGI